ncbi:hypothetical protein NKT34_00885 [Paenibacillus polysaccharolyticus]|uniref:Uncharacterized protein n=2 Tax=Paenibacillus TaxID=44249 RepID=A0A1G5LQ82_9BACL|nr:MULTISPECIES: hypothetical protein [Paenibacillus]MBY0206995.1 hypothetical protein [Paenibacillus cucumis (ex Kampfer et al. 2016)]MCP1131855.1 hypothetical protein [Paenibacillus polysaccharolyticus]MDP9701702.1 hypothetical protein [Paenibacillus intestini]SCZ14319.1 hypothetical protein SAMN05720606_1326 [Paenibacillus polysaccharolyticus]
MSKRKLLMTAIGAGVTYLMRNKQARDKVISTVSNMVKKNGSSSRTARPRVEVSNQEWRN